MLAIPGYTISRQIYDGRRSQLFQGHREMDNLPVIIKTLKNKLPLQSEKFRFQQEYNILQTLGSYGAVRSYAMETIGNTLAIVMEDFGGISLDQYRDIGKIKLSELVSLFIRIAEIVDDIHQQSIVHKDINPTNIVWNRETNKVKLIDFGISSRRSKEKADTSSPDIFEGTLGYMSPEQTGRMNRSVDYRTDLYSMGVTFYEILTAQLPFQTNDSMGMVYSHFAKKPEPPSRINSDIPGILSDIILKLLAKMPEHRYQSAAGLKSDLETCLENLQTDGTIKPFKLGLKDISHQFRIPHKLYNRNNDIQALLIAYDCVSLGAKEVMMISGAAGIGKSSLVNEIRNTVINRGGNFISGKFDPVKRDIPYESLIDAFRELVLYLLAQSPEVIDQWRKSLQKALGVNGNVIVSVIPELELIIGKQAPVPALPSRESGNRFNLVFQKFVSVFATKSHPLVIFLDNLQWADLPSLKLIEVLMTSAGEDHLLVIGSFRDTEIDDGHPLMKMLEAIKENDVNVNTIRLEPLELIHVKQLLAEIFMTDLPSVKALAELCFQKTHGNPLFLNQLLLLMHEEGGIFFNKADRKWKWDFAKLNQVKITDNVVALMIDKIKKLPDETSHVLKVAACIGINFDVQMLSQLTGISPKKIDGFLKQPIQDGLLESYLESDEFNQLSQSKLHGFSYAFSHNRVHQAIYSLVDIIERRRLHLEIGRIMLENNPQSEKSEQLFTIVTHWNLGRDAFKDKIDSEVDNEKGIKTIAELNLLAGKKAKDAAAFESAYNYFKSGIAVIETRGWEKQYDLTLALYIEAVESAYLNSDFVQMESLADIVEKHVKTFLDKVKIYEVRILAYIVQNRLTDAIDTALYALKQMGIILPKKPGIIHILWSLARTKLLLKGKNESDLISQKPMDDPFNIAAIRILTRMASAAFFSVPELLPLITFQQIKLTVKYGVGSDSATAFAIFGLLECGVTGNIKSGCRHGEMAIQMFNRLDTREMETKVHLICNSQIRHWETHAKNTLEPLLSDYQSGLETGDLEYAAYGVHIHCCNSFCIGKNLIDLERKFNYYGEIIKRLKQKTAYSFHQIWHQAALNLIGESSDPARLTGTIYDADKMFSVHLKANDRTSLFDAYFHQMMLSYHFQNYKDAVDNAERAEEFSDGVTGMLYVPVMVFYACLSRLAFCRQQSGHKRKRLLRKVARDQKKMKKWAQHAPENFLHKLYLINAEYSRITNDHDAARCYYHQAMDLAAENGYINERAMASELFAGFWQERQEPAAAFLYLVRARQEYQAWGATGKVRHFDETYEKLFDKPIEFSKKQLSRELESTTSSMGIEPGSFDALSVVKASQVISGEIHLDELLKKLMTIVIENAGAEAGSFLIKRDNRLVVEAEKKKNDENIVLLPSIPLDEADLPASIIHFVERTKEPVFFDNASGEDFFSSDAYIKNNKPKSVLCIPVVQQNKLVAVLYGENNLVTGAFTTERQETLEIIASQAAISLENALLYEEVKRTESKWRTLIRTAKEGFIEFDSQAYITDVNPEMCAIIGMEKKQIIGRNLMTTVDSDNAEIFQKELSLRKQGKRSSYEITFQRPDNSQVHCLVKATPIYEDAVQIGSFAMVTDITERKLAEEEIRQLNEELEERVKLRTEELEASLEKLKTTQKQLVESEKMVSLGSLVAGIAHEINTPVGIAVTAASFLQDRTQTLFQNYSVDELSRAELEKYIKAAEESSGLILSNLLRAAELVRSFKQVAVDQSAEEKRKFNVKTYIEELLLTIGPKYKKTGHSIEVLCPEGLEIKSYPGAIAQILTNLIMNSLIHGFDGVENGKITIEIKIEEQNVCIVYQDNGQGMDKETIRAIYDPFFTTRRSYGGTGLGMHLVYNLVTQTIGGVIECTSALGEGATFTIKFPYYKET